MNNIKGILIQMAKIADVDGECPKDVGLPERECKKGKTNTCLNCWKDSINEYVEYLDNSYKVKEGGK